ncbi:hypothetical protein BC938DRAFT_478061 [Jimgerdemannia flammicorona]|uniref:Uncharacterized protein n=1 Tax=Jimgerdemannia flammicorona TaxID=994334 RepID=A0A433QNF8_9FUNG|nr:hypothetical protein BC938DRAFT_478061 [Jimgerdemannia flammicorona]
MSYRIQCKQGIVGGIVAPTVKQLVEIEGDKTGATGVQHAEGRNLQVGSISLDSLPYSFENYYLHGSELNSFPFHHDSANIQPRSSDPCLRSQERAAQSTHRATRRRPGYLWLRHLHLVRLERFPLAEWQVPSPFVHGPCFGCGPEGCVQFTSSVQPTVAQKQKFKELVDRILEVGKKFAIQQVE